MLPNNEHTPGAATSFATHLVGTKEYPVGMMADSDGHIQGSLPAFAFVVPPVAVAANKIFFDLHNGGAAGTVIRLRKLFAIIALDVAVAPVVGFRIDHMRTNSVGTGGTAFTTAAAASKTGAAFWPFAPSDVLPAGITARVAPTAGAADHQWLFPNYFASEESQVTTGTSSAAAFLVPYYNLLPEMPFGQAVELPVGYGLKLVQGAVAAAGSIGFLGAFTVQ
jgi:hypothetical protein